MNRRLNVSAVTKVGNALLNASAIPGRYGSILILILVFVVLISVVGSQFGLGELFTWDTSIPLFGTKLNMTSIGELQWHLFALLIMLSGAYALKEDRHIRVDVMSDRFSIRTRLWIDVLGDLFFLLPFFALLAWYSFLFTQNAYNFGEQSNAGGLIDRYLVKAVLPIGSVLMLIAGVGRILRNLGLLFGRKNEDAASKELGQ
ncbi:TRAP transporter small permease subunit [Pusillimonas sp. ANT_WB101]|uniref:TRAP transporter small permease subunit n=1 Tax=Pusillimonas sp. ANT_WB101 TaxID=2597356 RepID=UPI0011F058EC|nr:TRAP transporter small permease subunit [Pusillimonas sp. ANT_WB101]KAA0892842.1 TRAP transporter small permease subunit [Pusillimonas sp. ANT_WB101]